MKDKLGHGSNKRGAFGGSRLKKKTEAMGKPWGKLQTGARGTMEARAMHSFSGAPRYNLAIEDLKLHDALAAAADRQKSAAGVFRPKSPKTALEHAQPIPSPSLDERRKTETDRVKRGEFGKWGTGLGYHRPPKTAPERGDWGPMSTKIGLTSQEAATVLDHLSAASAVKLVATTKGAPNATHAAELHRAVLRAAAKTDPASRLLLLAAAAKLAASKRG